MGKLLQYDGHYGTTRHKADGIVRKNEILMAPTGEHGRGIYLVEDMAGIRLAFGSLGSLVL